MADNKPFFYIPTYAVIIIFVLILLSLVFELFLFANMYGFESISVGETVYRKGEQGYIDALQKLQIILIVLSLTSLILAVIFGYFSFKRIRNPQS
jgi:hypothetical protein